MGAQPTHDPDLPASEQPTRIMRRTQVLKKPPRSDISQEKRERLAKAYGGQAEPRKTGSLERAQQHLTTATVPVTTAKSELPAEPEERARAKASRRLGRHIQLGLAKGEAEKARREAFKGGGNPEKFKRSMQTLDQIKERSPKLADKLKQQASDLKTLMGKKRPVHVWQHKDPEKHHDTKHYIVSIRKPPADGSHRIVHTASRLLGRQPLLLELVSAISVGPSPHVRPDLIGRTIAGGKKVKGATTTADVGLRSSPSGFAVGAHRALGHKHKKKSKRKREGK